MKLEPNMYVRTTYGIGRITNAYIVYSDDGCLWHLSYMTDNPKIELAIYTKNNSWELFGEVQKDHSIKYEPLENNFDLVKKVYEQKLEKIVCYVPVNKKYPRDASLYDDHKFIKASYNIIDLIEEGDYVNGQRVYYDEELNFLYVQSFDADGEFYQESITKQSFIDNIKQVVTHEQMEQMAYKVGE